ncbi:MAG: PAS domain S-box protein [Pelovirga sp.]
MVPGRKKITSINSRLKLLSVVSLLIFLLTTVIVVFLLGRLHNDVDVLIGDRFEQVLTNSHNRADFGLLVARLGVFRNTFYGNPELVATEGQELESLIESLAGRVTDNEQRLLLYHLQEEYHHFLNRAYWINFTLLQRRWQEEELDRLLLFTSETLMKSIRTGRADDNFMETFVLLRQLRAGFQQLSKLFLLSDRSPRHLLLPVDSQQIEAVLAPLRSVAGHFVNESSPYSVTGRELLGRLDYVVHLLKQYQREKTLLLQQSAELDQLTEQITVAMEVLDQRTGAAVRDARGEIGDTLYRVFATALVVCFVLVAAMILSHRWLFRRHVQKPMELVGRRLQAFEQGDHSTPMQLSRVDEWHQIESVFNDMLSSLEKSVASLRDSERRYREIFTNATEGIFRASLDGRFLALNPAAVAMLGYTSEAEAVAAYDNLEDQLYCNPEDRQRLVQGLQEHGRNTNVEIVAKRKGGQRFWMHLNNHLVYDEQGKPHFIEGTARDITVRKVAEKNLHQVKNFLQRIIDSMPSILVAVDTDLKVTLWNRKAEQESRLRAAQARGLALQEVLALIDGELLAEKINAARISHKAVRINKVEGRLEQGGRKRHFDILIYPLPDKEEGGAVIHIDEVTEQVALEQILMQKEKMESIAGLAAGFAHELNNPLAVILQSVQVLERRLSADFSRNAETAEELGTSIAVISEYLKQKKCDTMLTSIAEAGHRAAKIVENIQTFSRRTSSDFSRYQIEELVERTLDLAVSDYDMRRHLNYQRIRIVREFQPVPEVVCDCGQIQQVILILLKNAAQALTEVENDPQITLRILSKGEYVCLEVRDNGIGMSPEVCRRVFDPFYSTQDAGQGVGLGLSIAYYIITQNHRGFMSVSSEAGSGSGFELYLPTLKNS